MLRFRGYQSAGAGACADSAARTHCLHGRCRRRRPLTLRPSAVGCRRDRTRQGTRQGLPRGHQHRRRRRSDRGSSPRPPVRRPCAHMASGIGRETQPGHRTRSSTAERNKGRPAVESAPWSCTLNRAIPAAGRSLLPLPFHSGAAGWADPAKKPNAASLYRSQPRQLSSSGPLAGAKEIR